MGNLNSHLKLDSLCGPDTQRVNGNAQSHLTRQTTCVSHRKPAIDQITPPVCKHTHRQICAESNAWMRASGTPVLGDERKMERSKSGIKSVRVRLRIAFPYRVTELVFLSHSFQRSNGGLSLTQHEWRRHGMRSRDVRGADADLDAL